MLTVDERLAALRALTVDEVKKFYGEFYGADVAEMAVVGDFERTRWLRLPTSSSSGWKSKRAVVRLTSRWTDVGADQPVVRDARQGQCEFQRRHEPAPPSGRSRLSGARARELHDRRRISIPGSRRAFARRRGSATDRLVIERRRLRKSGTFTISAIAAPENIARVESAVKEELARAVKDGFTADELKVAKQGWLQSREVTRTEDFSIASSLRAYLYQGRTFTWDADLERKVQAHSADQIVAALRRHIDPAKLTVMKAGDFAKK